VVVLFTGMLAGKFWLENRQLDKEEGITGSVVEGGSEEGIVVQGKKGFRNIL
jgi:hypothetical protein